MLPLCQMKSVSMDRTLTCYGAEAGSCIRVWAPSQQRSIILTGEAHSCLDACQQEHGHERQSSPKDPNSAAPMTTAGILSRFFLQGMACNRDGY